MEIQDLLIFGVFVFFWAISFLTKKMKVKSGSSGNKGFTYRVLEFIAELKAAGEKEFFEPPVVDSPPVAPVNLNRNVEGGEDVVGVNVMPDRPIASCPDADLSIKKVGRHVVRQSSPDSGKFKGVRVPGITAGKSKRGRKFCRKKLREAVIWAEIIGPPVGLKVSDP